MAEVIILPIEYRVVRRQFLFFHWLRCEIVKREEHDGQVYGAKMWLPISQRKLSLLITEELRQR